MDKTLNGFRGKTTRVKTAKGRTNSSVRWLQRQLNDPYVQQAKRHGYRSRAAFKLIDIQHKFHLIRPHMTLVDLGAAPGGWTQIALQLMHGKEAARGQVIGLDLLDIEPIPGATLLKADFTTPEGLQALQGALNGRQVDGVLSDMAPSTTGHKNTDHLRIVGMVELVVDFAVLVLKPGGFFVTKVFQGGMDTALLKTVKLYFEKVVHFKPPASRKESNEIYMIGTGFRKPGATDESQP